MNRKPFKPPIAAPETSRHGILAAEPHQSSSNAHEAVLLDYQTAPYEALCGCVGCFVPAAANHMYQEYGPNGPQERVNHTATEMLLRGAVGCRIVLANCDKCGGTGLVPL